LCSGCARSDASTSQQIARDGTHRTRTAQHERCGFDDAAHGGGGIRQQGGRGIDKPFGVLHRFVLRLPGFAVAAVDQILRGFRVVANGCQRIAGSVA